MKIISYAIAIFVGLVVVAPPINFDIPTMINSHQWVFYVIASAFFGVCLFYTSIHWSLKVLAVYCFVTSFLSQVPHASFNAYILVVATIYLLILIQKADFKVIVRMIEVAFWVQVMFLVMQHFGKDTLINFDRPEKLFFGTVAVPMRMGSLFAIMTPLLLIRSKWYLAPLIILSIASGTLGFSFALAGAFMVWYILTNWPFTKTHWCLVGVVALFVIYCSIRSWTHIYVEVVEGRWPIWGVIVRSWLFDTHINFHGFGSPLNPAVQTGPFDLKTMLIGHGIDTFLPLFPYYKYDPNPFGNPHNDWLKILWETGLIGFLLFSNYCRYLMQNVYKARLYGLLAGLVLIGINMFFAFPSCMTQTVFLMIAYIAFCEKKLCQVSET